MTKDGKWTDYGRCSCDEEERRYGTWVCFFLAVGERVFDLERDISYTYYLCVRFLYMLTMYRRWLQRCVSALFGLHRLAQSIKYPQPPFFFLFVSMNSKVQISESFLFALYIPR